MALLDFLGRVLILISHFALGFLCFSQLYFHITKRVLQFFVLEFTQSEHLLVLDFGSLLTFDSKSPSCFYPLALLNQLI